MARFVDRNENWSKASTVPETQVAIALYNIGVRGKDLTDLLAIAYGAVSYTHLTLPTKRIV